MHTRYFTLLNIVAMLQRLALPWRRTPSVRHVASMRAVLWHGDPDPKKMKVAGAGDLGQGSPEIITTLWDMCLWG